MRYVKHPGLGAFICLLGAVAIPAQRAAAQMPGEAVLGGGLCRPEVAANVRPYVSQSKHPSPRLYAMADGLFLMRDPDGRRNFAVLKTIEEPVEEGGEPTVNRTTMLGTQHLDFNFQEGARVLLGLRLGENFGVESVFFGSYDWTESAAVGDNTLTSEGLPDGADPIAGSLASPFTNFGDPDQVEGLDFNNFASIRDYSTFWNIEWNLRHTLRMPPGPLQASVLVGGRYARITEQFDYFTRSLRPEPTGTVNQVRTRVDNDMIGAQLGALIEYRLREECWLDFEIKGALMKNYASQATRYVRTGEMDIDSLTSADNDVAIILGDLSLSFVYQFSPAMTFRAGYNAIWIDGLALGYRNFNSDVGVLETGPGQLDHEGKVVYHGPHIGLIFAW